MKTKTNNYGYGAVSNTDVKSLEKSLSMLTETFSRDSILNIVQIGYYDGKTIGKIRDKIVSLGYHNCQYWNIDNDISMKQLQRLQQLPYDGFHFILCDSSEAFIKVPDDLHLVFIDGCHCVNHAMLDFLNYGYKVVKNGLVVFHDTLEEAQGLGYQGHGPKHPEWGTALVAAFEKLNIMQLPNWKHIFTSGRNVDEDIPTSTYWGGISVFQKTSSNPK